MVTGSRPCALALACLLLLTSATAAQTRVEVGPILGLYAPLGSFGPAVYYSTALPNDPADLSGVAVGGQARWWVTPRVGLQADATVAFSRVGGGPTPIGVLPATAARVFTGSAQVLYSVLVGGDRRRIWVSAGAGVVRHGGAAYRPYGSPIQLAGAFGIGSTFPLGRKLSVLAGATALLYQLNVRDSVGTSLEHGTQFDARLQTGISWTWR